MRLESLASTSALVILSFSLGGCSLASLRAPRRATCAPGPLRPVPGLGNEKAITQDSVPGVLGNEKAATASAINSKAIKAMVASGQVASSAKLVWYNAQGQAVGPVMIDANGRVIPAALDTNGSNDAGVALNPEGIVPAVLASAAPGANRAAVAQAATTESHTLVGLSQHVQISASAYHWFDRVGGTDLGPVQYDGNGEIITTGHEGQIYNPSGL
ncbi:MAG: hypothetical protein IPL47_00965 [Phyllobacteriaceae bacterium]|nr:hypothetical protein [Phyllobacteriaceae bacterium]